MLEELGVNTGSYENYFSTLVDHSFILNPNEPKWLLSVVRDPLTDGVPRGESPGWWGPRNWPCDEKSEVGKKQRVRR